MQIWGDDDFTFYPYQAGIPYYFKMIEEPKENHEADKMRVVIGARPTKARFFDCNINTETDEICSKFNFGTNMRATAEYREQVAKVLVNRCRKAVQ